jgi:uncharacterized protein (DUF302 family)
MFPFPKRLFLTVLIAGTLDLLCAYTDIFIRSGRISRRMFQYIAGGALGLKNTMDKGLPVIFLGIFFHYFIVLCFALFFFALYKKSKFFGLNTYLIALLYGFFIWSVMNLIVLPMTALPSHPVNIADLLTGGLILSLAIGLPLSLSARAWRPPVPHPTLFRISQNIDVASPKTDTMPPAGIITRTSPSAVTETVEKLIAFLKSHGVTIYARIDQRAELSRAGIPIKPLEYLLFGNPLKGGPVMEANPLAALDLPLKLIVWEDDAGVTQIAFYDAAFIGERFGIPPDLTRTLDLNAVVAAALGPA